MNPRQTAEFIFRPEIHDADQKVVLGHVLPAGRGIEDGEEVLDIVARHPATARYIAKKLATRFVSDDPPKELVVRAAQKFLETDGDIREVVRTIVTFTAMTDATIDWYIATGEPMDKAGSYAIQGIGGSFVQSITGSLQTVVGLPMVETATLLHRCGFSLADFRA